MKIILLLILFVFFIILGLIAAYKQGHIEGMIEAYKDIEDFLDNLEHESGNYQKD